MKIAVIGWGSLIWDRRELRIEGEWNRDGPTLPIEFARVSESYPLTLVIYPVWENVRTLYADSSYKALDDAIGDLAEREGTPRNNIGWVSIPDAKKCSRFPSDIVQRFEEWTQLKGFDAVVWTHLAANFAEETGTDFKEENVISYLRNLKGEKRRRAKEYVVMAPRQVSTKFRRRIEDELSWRCESPI